MTHTQIAVLILCAIFIVTALTAVSSTAVWVAAAVAAALVLYESHR